MGVYSETHHAAVHTPEHSPDAERDRDDAPEMGIDLVNNMSRDPENPRPVWSMRCCR